MKLLIAACLLALCALARGVDWCYHDPSCNDATWPTLFPDFCNDSRQSPIDIDTADAKPNPNLTEFTFINFSSTNRLDTIKNTGHTVKVTLDQGLQVSGGDLPGTYDTLQFHLHWGDGTNTPGSEHTLNDKRFPMELHFVNIKSTYNRNTTLGVADPEGFAALGFFIEESAGNETGQPEAWKLLANYLTNITYKDDSIPVTSDISLDALLNGVNLTRYYRYYGSLTTPKCYESVIWTVFHDTIKVSKDLIDLFSSTVRIGASDSSPYMINVYRNIQPALEVSTQDTSGSAIVTCSLGMIVLSLAVTWS